jgi:hypothetical protein
MHTLKVIWKFRKFLPGRKNGNDSHGAVVATQGQLTALYIFFRTRLTDSQTTRRPVNI